VSFRDTSSFGKRQEYTAITELLKRGFDVYLTLVDDQGIDCIIRRNARTYIDVQIKARSSQAKQWTTFAAMHFSPRRNFYFIFYIERSDALWVMPSHAVARMSHQNAAGANKGRYTLVLPKRSAGGNFRRFARYYGESGFAGLRTFRAV
jgi:hypothetical protein